MADQEIELKLLADPKDLAKFRRNLSIPGAVRGPWSPAHRILTVYYDTADLYCRRNLMALRLRRIGRRHVQSIKNGYGDGGFVRGEWEVPARGGRLDLDLFPEVVAAMVPQSVRADLRPVFQTDFRRVQCELVLGPGRRVELAIDQGHIKVDGDRAPIGELELELKEGRLADLFALALHLTDFAPLRLALRSKAERAYDMIEGTRPRGQKSKHADITREDSVAVALARIVRRGALDILANEAAVRSGEPEAVHQMRVALRRTRSAFSLFARMVPAETLAVLKTETGWLAAELGPVRDIDVFLSDILTPVRQRFPNETGLKGIEKRARLLRAAAHGKLVRTIDSARYGRLMIHLLAWAEQLAATEFEQEDKLGRPIAGFAAKAARRRYRKLRELGRGFARLDIEQRHQVRIAGKKLRYAVEFFAALWPGRRGRGFLPALRELQDRLGHLNDVAMAETMLAELAPRGGRAAGLILDWQRQSMARNKVQAEKLWRQLAKLSPPWA